MLRILEGSHEIEIHRELPADRSYRYAIFDFDGTLSLIREGWREIMIPMMVDVLVDLNTDETPAEIEKAVAGFVDALTGQQTIYQMIRLCEEIQNRGGTPEPPLVYKQRYHDRLLAHIDERIRGLETGSLDPGDWVIPGSHTLLKQLAERGLELYLASGTDHAYVLREAELLGLAPYFGDRMFGALDNYEDFSKEKLIREILETPGLAGTQLLGFGDGYVEIENVSDVGGTAIGVASNEAERTGIDPWKRDRLVNAGASLIVPEYREQDLLLAHLFAD